MYVCVYVHVCVSIDTTCLLLIPSICSQNMVAVCPFIRCQSQCVLLLDLTCSGPSWLKNLYFAYLLTLRAVVKAEPYWEAYQFFTGNEAEDLETRNLVSRVIAAAK